MATPRTLSMFLFRGDLSRLATSVKLLQHTAAVNSCMKSHERYKFTSPQIHPNPNVKFKKHRARKTMKQMWEFIEEKPDPHHVTEPTRLYTKAKEIAITSIGTIMNPYIPMEKDVRKSLSEKESFEEFRKRTRAKINNIRFARIVKKYDKTHNQKEFLAQAHHIYITAHKCIARIREDDEELLDYVTQDVFGQMTNGMYDKTLQWEFIESVEQPRIVNVAAGDLLVKDNAYAQITVRFHTLQKLAIYNRFGRLTYGDREQPRYVLEYVVFEKHISDTEGRWRIAGKVTPEWKKKGFSFLHTWKQEVPEKEPIGLEDLEPFRVHRCNPEYPDEMTNYPEEQSHNVKSSVETGHNKNSLKENEKFQ
ncbi:large ribosomal subunit protein mL45-like [Saccostrea echinata]|uniref:large ribosomal subunit protein mL45-like n=1 Tax=Saccostrea echinata TaxID=191078 RepID=UPI002A83D385|nr:large ribosomal subunit protein mL45-like [Saccostrea echinata]